MVTCPACVHRLKILYCVTTDTTTTVVPAMRDDGTSDYFSSMSSKLNDASGITYTPFRFLLRAYRTFSVTRKAHGASFQISVCASLYNAAFCARSVIVSA